MTRTFMEYESEQYYKKSPEQVALTDYAGKKGFLNILKKLTNNNGDISIIEGMDKIKHKLNNFIPKFNCYCSNPAEYFSLQRIVEKRYNLYLREEVFGLDSILIDTKDLRCEKHSKDRNLMNNRTTLYPIKFNILEQFSEDPRWARKKVNDALLHLAGFNGKPKTKENCDNFLHNLSIREDIREYKKPSRVYVDAENKSIQLYLL